MLRRALLTLIGAATVLLLMALAAGPATAAKPTITVIDIPEETFIDEFLTEECGVEVTTTVEGKRLQIEFDNEGGLQFVGPVNIGLTATAGENTFRFRDVGVDVVRVEPDGTVILSIVGQVPFQFTGVLKINAETDEVIFEPQHTVDTERACAVLTG
jgi:hypothetical protein